MATHQGMLLAYGQDGGVIATLDYLVLYDADGRPLGLADFAAHEEAGGEMTDLWRVDGETTEGAVVTSWEAKGSKVWPEWLGGRAHDFRVELVGPPGRKWIGSLVHKTSGHRRERGALEATIADRIVAADGGAADIRDLVGGPDRPLRLDDEGRTLGPVKRPSRPSLPLVGVAR